MLFIIALRDILRDTNLKNQIDNSYLKNPNISNDNIEYKIKLKQVESDWEVYKKLILQQELSWFEKKAAVYRNYNFFKTQLQNKQPNSLNQSVLIRSEPLLKLLEALQQFRVITIELEPDAKPWEHPQEIFESMNSLGKPLSFADLIRNYLLLGFSPEEQDYLYENCWKSIEKGLRDQISNFIRDYLQYKKHRAYPKPTEKQTKQLYGIFKDLVKMENKKEFLEELKIYAIYYECIALGRDTGIESINKELEKIRIVKATTCYSFLLGILEAWANEELSDDDTLLILKSLNTYFIRRRIIGESTGENKIIPDEWIEQIPDLVNAEDKEAYFYKIITGDYTPYIMRLPNDTEMMSYMSSMNFYHFGSAKFILSLIEEYLSNGINDFQQNLKTSLERIMPQYLSSAWQNELGADFDEIHNEWLHNIGNITLIHFNSELDNSPFSEKKYLYERDDAVIARAFITDQKIWNENAIQSRGTNLIKILIEIILPIPFEYRSNNNYNYTSPSTRYSAELAERPLKSAQFSMESLVGKYIQFTEDPNISALVVSDRKVRYNSEEFSLTGLTKKLKQERGTFSSISGPHLKATLYWTYQGKKLSDILY